MPRLSKHQTDTFCTEFLRTGDPYFAAEAAGVSDPGTLLRQDAVRARLRDERRVLTDQLTRADVLRCAARLAFGRSNDCVRLALDPEADLDKLDLRLLSELKRSEKGTVEIKLMDRAALLEFLYRCVGDDGGGFDEFFRAMAEPAAISER